MKKIIYAVLLVGASFSCGNETPNDINNDDQSTEQALDLTKFASFDLNPYQIPTEIYLPNDESLVGGAVEPQVEHEEDGFEWVIAASRAFEMKIEDFGEKDALALYKENMQRYADIHKYEILEDSANVLVYKQTVNKQDANSMEHYSYHCVGMFTADGINYLISSRDAGYEKPTINVMRTTIAEIARRSEKPAV